MKPILEDYKNIYINYPNDKILNKMEKKQKHNCIMKWSRTTYEDIAEFNEVIDFINSNKSIPIIRPFVKNVLVKIVYKDICNNDFDSLKGLFEITPSEVFCTSDDYIFILEEESNFKYTAAELTNLVLMHYPDNIKVLNHQYSGLLRCINYSIHEVPCGILCGINGADLNGIVSLRKDLEKFEELSKKLSFYNKDKKLIKYCDTMYSAYEDYLKNRNKYNGFDDYLTTNSIIY